MLQCDYCKVQDLPTELVFQLHLFSEYDFARTIVHRIYLPCSIRAVWGLYVSFSEKSSSFLTGLWVSGLIHRQDGYTKEAK